MGITCGKRKENERKIEQEQEQEQKEGRRRKGRWGKNLENHEEGRNKKEGLSSIMISIVMMIIVLKTAVPAVTAAAAHGSHSPTFASWAAPQKGLSQLQRVKQNEKSV